MSKFTCTKESNNKRYHTGRNKECTPYTSLTFPPKVMNFGLKQIFVTRGKKTQKTFS